MGKLTDAIKKSGSDKAVPHRPEPDHGPAGGQSRPAGLQPDAPQAQYTLAEAAKIIRVEDNRIHLYAHKGLINPLFSSDTSLRFSPLDIVRLRIIKEAEQFGYDNEAIINIIGSPEEVLKQADPVSDSLTFATLKYKQIYDELNHCDPLEQLNKQADLKLIKVYIKHLKQIQKGAPSADGPPKAAPQVHPLPAAQSRAASAGATKPKAAPPTGRPHRVDTAAPIPPIRRKDSTLANLNWTVWFLIGAILIASAVGYFLLGRDTGGVKSLPSTDLATRVPNPPDADQPVAIPQADPARPLPSAPADRPQVVDLPEIGIEARTIAPMQPLAQKPAEPVQPEVTPARQPDQPTEIKPEPVPESNLEPDAGEPADQEELQTPQQRPTLADAADTQIEIKPEKKPENKPTEPTASAPTTQVLSPAASETTTPPQAPAVSTQAAPAPQPAQALPPPVTVGDIKLWHDALNNRYRVDFTILKRDPGSDSEPIDGVAFAILATAGNDADFREILLPAGEIKSGKPAQMDRGERFSIRWGKPMQVSAVSKLPPYDITTKKILIFSPEGDLLLEKEFSEPAQPFFFAAEKPQPPSDDKTKAASPIPSQAAAPAAELKKPAPVTEKQPTLSPPAANLPPISKPATPSKPPSPAKPVVPVKAPQKTNNPEAVRWEQMSYDAATQGDYDLAIAHAGKAIELDPGRINPYINRSWAYIQKNRLDAAIQDCRIALLIDPQNALAHNNQGLAYQRKNQMENARDQYSRACELGLDLACRNLADLTVQPRIAELIDQSQTAFKTRDWDAVIRTTTEVISLDSQNAIAYTNRSAAYAQKNSLNKALKDSNDAIKYNPDFALAHNNRGYVYELLGNTKLAMADYLKSCSLGLDLGCENYDRLNKAR